MARSTFEVRRLQSAMSGHAGDGGVPSSSGHRATQSPLRQHIHHARKRSLSLLGGSSASVHQPKGRTTSTLSVRSERHSGSSPADGENGEIGNNGIGNTSAGSDGVLMSSSPPTRFTTSTSDFHLPKRSNHSAAPSLVGSTPSVGTSPLSASRGDTDYAVSATSLPLLRRAAAAAAFANANRMRLRRGSMLGREVARNAETLTSSDEDEVMDSGDLNDDYDDEDRRRRSASSAKVSTLLAQDGALVEARISATTAAGRKGNTSTSSEGEGDDTVHDGDDDIMQIETGDVSLENVKLDSRSRPSTPPPDLSHITGATPSPGTLFDSASSSSSFVRGGAARKGGLRSRGQNAVRDRGMLRVAASLRDEARPSDSEIASEAKLQRKLAPESESLTPTTPRLLAVGAARSPTTAKRPSQTLGAGAAALERNALDDDEMIFHDHFDPYDAANSSDEDDFASVSNSKTHGHHSLAGATGPDEEVAVASAACGEGATHANGIAIPGAGSSQRDQLWLGFREATPGFSLRNSPGAERMLGKGRPSTAGTGAAPSAAPTTTTTLSTSIGSPYVDLAMDTDHSSATDAVASAVSRTSGTMPSPSVWGKTTKRKMESDRYEPYSASLYKRRAVSPIAIVSAGTAGGATAATIATTAGALQRARSSTPTMMTAQSPLLTAVLSQQSPLLSYQAGNSNALASLPVPTPLSIPSPTLSVTRSGIGAVNGGYLSAGSNGTSTTYSKSVPATLAMNNGVGGASGPANDSPTSTRPSTPTHASSSYAMSGASTSLYGTMASPAVVAQGANGTPGAGGSNASGSGPGYGSGALGLSLGRGSRRFKEEQEEQEEQEDMLDDVNAIRLGER